MKDLNLESLCAEDAKCVTEKVFKGDINKRKCLRKLKEIQTRLQRIKNIDEQLEKYEEEIEDRLDEELDDLDSETENDFVLLYPDKVAD